ncbi:MAG: AAA family ATPase [Acetobacteraceae bacterium]|nr:AAA family ATPase [Acetobacteraceae bacterium]
MSRLSGSAPIETPLSAVFVGADTAWKLRKSVRLPFIDFTHLPTRALAAQRELELNRAWAPTLYRDVIAVTEGAQGPELGGNGRVIDHVVRMARVAEGDFLDVRATQGGLSPELLDGLADMVAAMHDALPPADNNDLAALLRVTRGNLATARVAGLPQARMSAWEAAVEARLAAHATDLAQRDAAGFVRRCHGDLHLGNLCLFDGKPTAFDALEFSEDMATIDTGYDLAFLLMDLDLRLGRAAANRVMNRYLARRPDFGMLGLMPIFLSLRALIRAHVYGNSGRDWRPYLDYAEAMLAPPPPVAVAIGGLPGSGKSTIARAIAPLLGPAPGAVVLRSDEIRKRLAGVPPEQRLPESAYTQASSRAVAETLVADFTTVLRAGHAVIADQTFIDPATRAAVQRASGDVPFFGFWLSAPPDVLRARVAARHGDSSDATVAVLNLMLQSAPNAGNWQEIDSTDPAASHVIATSLPH